MRQYPREDIMVFLLTSHICQFCRIYQPEPPVQTSYLLHDKFKLKEVASTFTCLLLLVTFSSGFGLHFGSRDTRPHISADTKEFKLKNIANTTQINNTVLWIILNILQRLKKMQWSLELLSITKIYMWRQIQRCFTWNNKEWDKLITIFKRYPH